MSICLSTHSIANDCSVRSLLPEKQIIYAATAKDVKSNHLYYIQNTTATELDYRLCKQHLLDGKITREKFFDGSCKIIKLSGGQVYSENQELSLFVLFKTPKQNASSTVVTWIDGGCNALHILESEIYIKG